MSVGSSKRFFKLNQNAWISGGVDYRFNWNGAVITAQWLAQARKALRQALLLAVQTAQGLSPIDTGKLRTSIRAKRIVLDQSRGVMIGVFGSFNVRYAIWQEIGYNRNGVFYPGHHYIRRAGDIAIKAFPGYFNARGGVFEGESP